MYDCRQSFSFICVLAMINNFQYFVPMELYFLYHILLTTNMMFLTGIRVNVRLKVSYL